MVRGAPDAHLRSRYTVASGSFSVTIPARNAVALHTGAKGVGTGNGGGGGGGGGGGSGTVTVNFAETATTTFGEVSGVNSGRISPSWLTFNPLARTSS